MAAHLSTSAARHIGHFDKTNRYTLKPEYETDTSRAIRSPSRAYPYSVYKHILTAKYYRSLTDEQRAALAAFTITA